MLSESMKQVLASSFAFYLKAKNFHWNVEGADFAQLHELFDTIAGEVYGSLDECAEYIRALDSYAPGSFGRFAELSCVEDQTKIPRATLMVQELYEDNQKVTELLKAVFQVANDENEQGVADFIAARLSAHGKWGWQLRSTLKNARS